MPKKNQLSYEKNDGSSLYCQLSQLAFGPFRSQRPGAFDSEPTHYLPQKTRDIIWPILCFTASVSCHAPSRRVAPSSKIHRLSLKKKWLSPSPPHPRSLHHTRTTAPWPSTASVSSCMGTPTM